MSLQNTVNQIFRDNTNYLQAQQVLNQARSLKSLSNDLYTDPVRFVYELVQNCDDSCQPKSILRIAIVDQRYLIVCHDGKPFDEDDVRGLCDVGCSTKERDEQKTGYKGLGFKAVFGQSDYVLIVSNGEYFRFEASSKVFQWNQRWGVDQQTWEQTNNRKFEFPWQICPIWTEKKEVPESIQKWFLGQLKAVGTIIRLKDVNETSNAIKQLTEQPNVFMFLRNIKTVRFSFNSPTETILNINQLRDGSIQIIYNWKPVSHWLLHRREIVVPDHAHDDSRLPEKLQHAKTIGLILAAKIDKNDNIESVQGRQNALFAYLPTKITIYNLPIVVNAQFSINASREHIHTNSSWNQFLFSRIPHEMIHWIGELMKQPKWRDKALDLLPNPISIQDSLADNYNASCPTAVVETPFLLNSQKMLLKTSEAVIDITGFSDPHCLGNNLIRDFILRTFSPTPRIAQYPFVANSSRLRKYKLLMFDWDHCMVMLNSLEFRMNFTRDQNIQFITYLFNHTNLPQIQLRLRQLPFLMDGLGVLRVPGSIYIPSQFSNTDWAMANDVDPYVHEYIMAWLRRNPPVLEWLKSLGVTEKTDEMFIRRKIIPNVRTYTTHENTLPTIKKLFAGFHYGHISGDLLSQLNKLKVLTVEGTLVAADGLYFSDPYSPRQRLSTFHLDEARLLSPVYFNEIPGVTDRLKQFFLTIGVQEDIRLIQFSEDQHDELVSAYRFKQTENLFRYGPLQFQYCFTLPFLDHTQRDYDFARYFWQQVINFIHPNQINQKEILMSAQQQIFHVDNLPSWFARARACIPTTTKQLLKSTEVFSSDLRLIAGDFLPVFVCTTMTPFPSEWQQFFQFKTQLTIEDHIQLLNSIYDRAKKSGVNDEMETCIQRVYTSLIPLLSTYDKRQLDACRPQSPFYLLSTNNNEFLPTTSLVASLSKDLTLPNQIPQLKLSTGNTRDNRLSKLWDFFNIRTVGLRDMTLSTNITSQPSLALRAKLRDIQPYLYELAHAQNLRDHRIDCDLELYEVDRLELVYNGILFALPKNVHVIDNRIYITRPWTSKGVLSELPHILCQHFKLPVHNAPNIQHSLLNEQIIPTRTSLTLNSTADLLGMEGPRQKFAAIIDRDNEQLFGLLNIRNDTSPGELLTIALDRQGSPYCGYVFHYTHLQNAVAILRDGALKCRNSLSVDEFQDSAALNVIQTTRNEIKEYARFYFRPLTPTQYCNENLGQPNLSHRYGNQPMCPIPVLFRIDLEAILAVEDIQWKIGLGNMANDQTEFDNTIDTVKKFDFQGVYADVRTERGKYSSQQEFLIRSQLNFNQLESKYVTIIFQDENARDSFKCMISHGYRSIIDTDKSFYYSQNARITIDYTDIDNEVSITMRDLNPSVQYGQLILQLSGDDTNRSIQGHLTASFQRGSISTVYSNQQLSFIADLNHIQYAVFYEYERRMWLIHTNWPNPRFIPPT